MHMLRCFISAGIICSCIACGFGQEWSAGYFGDPNLSAGGSLRYKLETTGGASAITDHNQYGRIIVSTAANSSWSINESIGHFNINSPVLIPQTGLVVPKSLWSLKGQTQYKRALGAGRSYGIALGAGSDSDRPFHSIHETVIQITADYRIPSGERNAWLFFLNYSNNRYFLNGAPLPGVCYLFRSESGKLWGIAGFPFVAVYYFPAQFWDMRLSLFGHRRSTLEIGRRLRGSARIHAGFERGGQTWLRSDRQDNACRLTFERRRVYAGFEIPLPYQLRLALSAGKEYEREFFETASAFSDDAAAAGLPDARYLKTEVFWRFGSGRASGRNLD